MTLVRRIIEAAYARSVANDAGKLADETELVPHVNEIFQAYFAMLASGPGRERYASSFDVQLAAGIGPLPTDVISLLDLETTDAPAVKVNVVPFEERMRSWHLAPAVYRRGANLVTLGRTGDPAAAALLKGYGIETPATLAAATDSLDARWPVRHNPLLILDVAVYLSVKDEGRSDRELQALLKERAGHFEMFLAVNGLATPAKQTPQRERRGDRKPEP